MTQRHPLTWPHNTPRRPENARRQAAFGHTGSRGYKEPLTVAGALARLQKEVDLLGASDVILSTNVELRLDGLPRSGQSEPRDPGAALYFKRKGKDICLPCDSFTKVADNIAGIAAHIRALRDIERYGVASVQQMFTGFEALPAPGNHRKRHWKEVFGIVRHANYNEDELSRAYRALAKERAHDENQLSELNVARDEALKEIRDV